MPLLVAGFAFSACALESASASPAVDSIRTLGYAVMFDKKPNSANISRLVQLCRRAGASFKCEMPVKGEAMGALGVFEYPYSCQDMAETFSTANKEQIFKSTIYSYKRDCPYGTVRDFVNTGSGVLRFGTQCEVYGILHTRFAYAMQSELYKNGAYILERETTLPGARQTRGAGGYIAFIAYFTILFPLDAKRTLRIIGSWDDVGGDVPVVGKIHASYRKIADGMDKGNQDILEYFLRKQKK